MTASVPELSDVAGQRFLVVALGFPIVEEIVFRGLLQGWLLKKGWGAGGRLKLSKANVAVSLLFTALHVIRHASLWSAAIMVPSLIFGFFRDRYGKLRVPISLHIFYNAGFVLLFA